MLKSDEVYRDIVEECAETWRSTANRLAMAGSYPEFYLYCKPSTETENGSLLMVSAYEVETIDLIGYELVTNEPAPRNVFFTRFFQWVWDRGRRAPVHAWGEVR